MPMPPNNKEARKFTIFSRCAVCGSTLHTAFEHTEAIQAQNVRNALSNNTPLFEPSKVMEMKPAERAILMLVHLKGDIYRVKAEIQNIEHKQVRDAALKLWQAAYDSYDAVQEFLRSK